MAAREPKRPTKPGPKPIYGAAMRRVLVMLDDTTIERAHALGGGNVSLGIRRALARA